MYEHGCLCRLGWKPPKPSVIFLLAAIYSRLGLGAYLHMYMYYMDHRLYMYYMEHFFICTCTVWSIDYACTVWNIDCICTIWSISSYVLYGAFLHMYYMEHTIWSIELHMYYMEHFFICTIWSILYGA